MLAPPPRAAGSLVSVTIAPDQPYLPLGVLLSLSAEIQDEPLRFTIHRADGTPSWQLDRPSGSVREDLERVGVAGLPVPTHGHEPGRYTLPVIRPAAHGEMIAEIRFEIVETPAR